MTSTDRTEKRHRVVVTMIGDRTIMGKFTGEIEADSLMADLDAATHPTMPNAVRFPTQYTPENTINIANALSWHRE